MASRGPVRSYDEFVQAWADVWPNMGGERDPIAELRRRFGIPDDITDQQIEAYYRQNGMPLPLDHASFARDASGVLGVLAGPLLSGLGAGFGGVANAGAAGAEMAATGLGSAAGAAAGGAAGAGAGAIGAAGAGETAFGGGLAAELAAAGGTGAGAGIFGTGEAVSGAFGPAAGELAGAASSFVPSSSAIQGSTALGRILGVGQTGQDVLSLTGSVLPSIFGAYASRQQTKALEGQAARYEAMGAPYRGRLEELYANPMAYLQSPEVTGAVQQGTDILSRSLSMGGNPIGSGNALQQLQSYATNQQLNRIEQEKDRLGGFGGLSYYNQAAPQAATNAIGSQANFYNAIGGGLADVFTPRRNRTLADILRESQYA